MTSNSILIYLLLSVMVFKTEAIAGCETLFLNKQSELNQLSKNRPTADVIGSYYINTTEADIDLTAPLSAQLAKHLSHFITKQVQITPHRVEVFMKDYLDDSHLLHFSPSGKFKRWNSLNIKIDVDEEGQLVRVYLNQAGFDHFMSEKRVEPFFSVKEQSVLRGNFNKEFTPLVQDNQVQGGFFVGGLVSISAEPPEGFFAASVEAELSAKGRTMAIAENAGVWIYRTADARTDSYFKFNFPTSKRSKDLDRQQKFLVATGLGPEINPYSSGGNEANLIWLGDEQNGVLNDYLQKIEAQRVSLDFLMQQGGMIQKVNDKEFVVANINYTHSLTKDGFNQLVTDPKLYRQVYSEEYDAYLASLFAYSYTPTKKSYLIATSRGCSQGCSICCSGGMSEFQFFTPNHMLEELIKIYENAGSPRNEKINLYFLDSNFNNNPARIIEFSRLLQQHKLKNTFNFYCRHSTLNGFLRSEIESDGAKAVNKELVKAYKQLGFKEVFMGIDGYDDASVYTLKTHKFKVIKGPGRAIYTFKETKKVVAEINGHGMYSKGFLLTNNPWISDYDRIDSYFNILELWLENHRFSIDSARDRSVIRLKPFAGSPITDAANDQGINRFVADGRFIAQGPLGELDEMMEFGQFGKPKIHSDLVLALDEFKLGLDRIIKAAENGAKSSQTKIYALNILAKIKSRVEGLNSLSNQVQNIHLKTEIQGLVKDFQLFTDKWKALPPFDAEVQRKAYEKAALSLQIGLENTQKK